MGRGHGSSRGGGGAKGFQGDASMKGYSAGFAKTLKEREEQIRTNDYFEMGTVYDEHGNVVFNNDNGTNTGVPLGTDFNDKIVTHNHPLYGHGAKTARLDGGGSLSPGDIRLAHERNAKEFRAVTRTRTYVLKRPSEGWHKGGWQGDKFYENPKLSYKKAKAKIDRHDKTYFRNYSGDKSIAGQRMTATYWHRVNKEFAKMQGYDYSSTKVN